MSRSRPYGIISLDTITALYDKRCEMYVGSWHEALASAYAIWASPTEGQAVLDLACGTGMVSRRLQRLVGPSGTVIGVDISEGMLAKARASRTDEDFPDFTKYIKADVRDLNAIEILLDTRGTWDIISCCSAITLLPDVEATIGHWVSWLKYGGKMIADIPAAGSEGGHLGPETLSVLSSEGLLEWNHDSSNSWLGASDRLVQAFEKAGMQVTVQYSGSYSERKIFPDQVEAWFDNLVANPFYEVRFASPDRKDVARERFKQIVLNKRVDQEYIHEKIYVIVAIGVKI